MGTENHARGHGENLARILQVTHKTIDHIWSLTERIRYQRQELFSLANERDSALRGQGIRTQWLKTFDGKTTITVQIGRTVIGLIQKTADVADPEDLAGRNKPYCWVGSWSVSNPDDPNQPTLEKGYGYDFGSCLTELCQAWHKRSKLEFAGTVTDQTLLKATGD